MVLFQLGFLTFSSQHRGQTQRVVDVPTRPGVTQRMVVLDPDKPGSRPVPGMPLGRIHVPTLVVHHKQDGCEHCRYRDLPGLMDKLTAVPRKELLTAIGGTDRGDPCEAMAYHGFNGIEDEVVRKIADWITRNGAR